MIFQRGDALSLVQDFWTIDPLTKVSTPADPTAVVFVVLAPDGTEQTFTFGVDGNVTNPQTGTFVCALDPQLPPGTYRYRCTGTGAVEAASEDTFDVIESGVLAPDPSGVATDGPCASWINGDDVASCGPDLGVGSDHWLLDDVAYAASYLLWQLSGRQYPGVCTRTVRPCRDGCSCWGGSLGLAPLYWASGWYAGVGNGYWTNECGDRCGCGSVSTVYLPGYPVREVTEVKIGGVPLAEFDPVLGYRVWRLDNRKDLVRMSTPQTATAAAQPQAWPSCQDITLDDDQPGTFSVSYTWGLDPPSLGKSAAQQMARELFKACSGDKCQLPSRVTQVVRQGVTYDRVVAMADMLRMGATGLQLVDAFLAACNPNKMQRRPSVWSPELRTARKTGRYLGT